MTIFHVLKHTGQTRIDQEPYFPKWFIDEFEKWRCGMWPICPDDNTIVAYANKLLMEYDPAIHGDAVWVPLDTE